MSVKNAQSKIMILGMSRTGSSALLRSLKRHPDINALAEPFHAIIEDTPKNASAYIRRVHDEESFSQTMNEILEEYNCIKHMMYHVPLAYHENVFRRKDLRIVFLYRKNVLQKVISELIGRQIQIWSQGEGLQSKVLSHAFKPIRMRAVKGMLRRTLEIEEGYRARLEELNVEYFDLPYEDLFGEEKDIKERLEVLECVLAFAGYDIAPLLEGKRRSKVISLLEPKMRLNAHETYRMVPHIDQIEKRYGSDETGYLFR